MRKKIIILLTCLSVNIFADDVCPPASFEPDGVIGEHEYVDLGLPSGTLWATCNLGADTPYEGGAFFAWGEVEPKENFTWENYKFFIEYASDSENGSWAVLEDIGSDICGTEYDAARHQWGSGWRLPNSEELYELRMLCWNKWTVENGVKGCRIYGPNEHSIFLPVSSGGLWYGLLDPYDGNESLYWTGIEEPETGFNGRPIEPSNRAKAIYVQYGGLQTVASRKAYFKNIRAVVNPSELGIENVVPDNNYSTLIYRNGCIYVNGNSSGGTIMVFDKSGRMMCSEPVVDGICGVPKLPTDTYIVSYSYNGNVVTTKKIVIK